MKPVILIVKRRFTKAEVVDALYLSFEDVTSYRELNRLVTRKHVLEFAQAILDVEKQYGTDIDEDTMADERQSIAQSMGEDLGLQARVEEQESFTKP